MTGRSTDPHEHLPIDAVPAIASNVLQYNATKGRWEKATPTAIVTGVEHDVLAGLGDDDHPQYTLVADLASTANAKGASLVGVEDVGSYFDSTDAEAVLQEAGDEIAVMAPGYDGGIIETIDIDVIEDTGAVKLQLQADGGGDLTIRFGSASFILDCTPVLEIALTAGTDAAHQENFVYVTESGGTLTLNTSTASFPATSHAPIATIVVQSAASLAIDGAIAVQAWTDHIGTETDNGHIAHINAKLRSLPAGWVSGVVPSDLVVSNPDAFISTTAGVVFQLHNHTMPAIDMQTPEPVYLVNDPSTAFKRVETFDDITQDASGGAINNKYMNLVLWGVVSENESECKLFINLPTDTYVVEASAQTDADLTAVYSIPAEFTGTGFLIARYVVQAKTSGAWSQSSKEDLRGKVPSTAPGGSGITDHALLVGLANDDHTQYTLADGSRDFTGDQNLGDSIAMTFGDAADAHIEYDGGSLLINAQVVGGGQVRVTGLIVPLTGGAVPDNVSWGYGSAFDSLIFYDGTNMNIRPDNVGTGYLKIENEASVEVALAVGQTGIADTSAVLECESTTKGFLPPRMDTSARDNIVSPAAGLIIYNTDAAKLNVYTGSWEELSSS